MALRSLACGTQDGTAKVIAFCVPQTTVVDAAIAGNADYLITYDGHFKVLSEIPFPDVVCLTLPEFGQVLDGQKT